MRIISRKTIAGAVLLLCIQNSEFAQSTNLGLSRDRSVKLTMKQEVVDDTVCAMDDRK